MSKFGTEIICFGDNDIKKVDHKMIFSAKEIKQKCENGEIDAVFISLLETAPHYKVVKQQLKEMGIPVISSLIPKIYTSMYDDDGLKK